MLLGLCFLAACGESSGFSEKATRSSNVEYSSEELLGKTVEEYEEATQENDSGISPQPKKLAESGFIELSWEELVAPGYDAETILEKYQPLIDKIDHGSDDAIALYEKLEKEFNDAPPNMAMANKRISLPGFIAPLEQVDGMITEFLLVPYFGACIHTPPPPANQTLYVKVARDYAIRNKDSYEPIWVSGELFIDGKTTEIGSAGYQIKDALISKYIY